MSAIVAAANVAVEAASGGAVLVTKTGGVDGTADASAVSSSAASGDFLLRCRVVGSGTAFIGVSSDPGASNDGASIGRALQLSGGVARIFESGLQRPPAFTLTGFGWLRRSGDTLAYLTGTDPASMVARRTVTGVSGPLFLDCSIVTLGATIELKWGPPAAFAAARPRRQRLSIGFKL